MINKIDEQLAALSEIAKELGVNKSKLMYYYKVNLIEPVGSAGGVFLFNKKDVIEVYNLANKKNIKLKEILGYKKNDSKKRWPWKK